MTQPGVEPMMCWSQVWRLNCQLSNSLSLSTKMFLSVCMWHFVSVSMSVCPVTSRRLSRIWTIWVMLLRWSCMALNYKMHRYTTLRNCLVWSEAHGFINWLALFFTDSLTAVTDCILFHAWHTKRVSHDERAQSSSCSYHNCSYHNCCLSEMFYSFANCLSEMQQLALENLHFRWR